MSQVSWALWLFFPLPQGPATHSRAFSQQGGRSPAVIPSVLTRLWLPHSGSPQCPVPPFAPHFFMPTPAPTYLGSLICLPHPQPKLLSQLLTQLSDIFILWKAGHGVRWVREPRCTQLCSWTSHVAQGGDTGFPSHCWEQLGRQRNTFAFIFCHL